MTPANTTNCLWPGIIPALDPAAPVQTPCVLIITATGLYLDDFIRSRDRNHLLNHPFHMAGLGDVDPFVCVFNFLDNLRSTTKRKQRSGLGRGRYRNITQISEYILNWTNQPPNASSNSGRPSGRGSHREDQDCLQARTDCNVQVSAPRGSCAPTPAKTWWSHENAPKDIRVPKMLTTVWI